MKENRIVGFLEDLMTGKPIEAVVARSSCGSEGSGLCEAATALGNTELSDSLVRDEDPLDRSTVCDRLKRKSVVGRSVDEEMEFAASHFYEIDADDQNGIDVPLLELIVRSDGLRLESEDTLLDFIIRLALADQVVRVRYLRREYLSRAGMSLFLERLGGSSVNLSLWDSLCCRLLLRQSKVDILLNEWKSLDGVISYPTKKHGGNVQEKGLVTITSNSVSDDPYLLCCEECC
jgi:hypothetical protein